MPRADRYAWVLHIAQGVLTLAALALITAPYWSRA